MEIIKHSSPKQCSLPAAGEWEMYRLGVVSRSWALPELQLSPALDLLTASPLKCLLGSVTHTLP